YICMIPSSYRSLRSLPPIFSLSYILWRPDRFLSIRYQLPPHDDSLQESVSYTDGMPERKIHILRRHVPICPGAFLSPVLPFPLYQQYPLYEFRLFPALAECSQVPWKPGYPGSYMVSLNPLFAPRTAGIIHTGYSHRSSSMPRFWTDKHTLMEYYRTGHRKPVS